MEGVQKFLQLINVEEEINEKGGIFGKPWREGALVHNYITGINKDGKI